MTKQSVRKRHFVLSSFTNTHGVGNESLIPLSHSAGLALRKRNGLVSLLFFNVRLMFFKCSFYVLLSSAKCVRDGRYSLNSNCQKKVFSKNCYSNSATQNMLFKLDLYWEGLIAEQAV